MNSKLYTLNFISFRHVSRNCLRRLHRESRHRRNLRHDCRRQRNRESRSPSCGWYCQRNCWTNYCLDVSRNRDLRYQ